MSEEIENKKLERRLTTLEIMAKNTREVLVEDIKKDIGVIKKQVFNEIPHTIRKLEKCLNAYKLSSSRWLIGILVTVLCLLIATIFNLIR